MRRQAVFRLAVLSIGPAVLIALFVAPGTVFAEVRVWAAGSTEEIQDRNRSPLPHDRVWDAETNTVTLAGVRGEHVPFQVAVTADHVNVYGVTVQTSALRAGSRKGLTSRIASLTIEEIDSGRLLSGSSREP